MEQLNNFFVNPHPETNQDLLDSHSDLLNDIVNTGLNIIKQDNDSEDWIDHTPPTMQLRNFVELVDSISVLIRKSCPDPAKHILRNALETSFLIQFLLQDNQREKFKAFIVSNIMEHKEVTNRLIQNSNSNAIINGANTSFEEIINHYNNLLHSDELKEIYDRQLSLKTTKRGKTYWYQIFKGINSIRDIAKSINQEEMYVKVYSSLSAATHSSDVISGRMKGNRDGYAIIKQIRLPENATTVTNFASIIAVDLYDKYAEKRTPAFINEYLHWRKSTSIKIKSLYSR